MGIIPSSFSIRYQRIYEQYIQLIFPSRCLICTHLILHIHHVCSSCWKQLQFISHPLCNVCGTPFACDMGIHPVCGECLRDPPPYHQARAALVYNPAARKLIAGFKYHDKTLYRHLLVQLLTYAGRGLFQENTILVPVPLHSKRLWKRRYNQSALLASTLSQLQGTPAYLDLLTRTKHTPPQASLKRQHRLENVRHAFKVKPYYRSMLQHHAIILIDDVMTTGATIHACCDALRRAGATDITVLTLARAPL